MWKKLLTPRWILTTLLAVAAVLVLIRLGFWQLDRLAQRQAYNSSVLAQINSAPLDLNAHWGDPNLAQLQYRHVTVTGKFDFSQQIAYRNQVNNGKPGMDLLTPLQIQGGSLAVLVDRGWIPLEDISRDQWKKYDEPGVVTVTGIIRSSQPAQTALIGLRDPLEGRLDAVNRVTLDRIQKQVDMTLLPVYVQQTGGGQSNGLGLPARSEPVFDLSEGPHEGYALQWFTFAAVLALGYPFYVRGRLASRPRKEPGTRSGHNSAGMVVEVEGKDENKQA